MSQKSPIFALAEQYTQEILLRSPETATMVGDHTNDHLLDDYSFKAYAEELQFAQNYYALFTKLNPTNQNDLLAKQVILSDLSSTISSLTSNHDMQAIGIFNSPIGGLKELFEFMNYDTPKDFVKLQARLQALPDALTSWLQSMVTFQSKGIVNSKRNVKELIRQSLETFQNETYSKFLSQTISQNQGVKLDSKLSQGLEEAAFHADLLHYFLATSLEEELLPNARDNDGVGAMSYQNFAQEYTYPNIDLEELYQFGLDQVSEITAKMHKTAKEILPNYISLSEVTAYLNQHPNYKITGKANLVAKLRAFTDDAITSLNGVEFDIPTEILHCDILLNEDSLDAAPYYTPPSEDLSRAGATWFPTMGKDEFTIWEQLSTWYHEAVPGHHLQCGMQALASENLTRYQRSIAWHSGYGEGWALYAERLMDELGFFTDPGYYFGYLQAQMLRASRIVLDLGLHQGRKDNLGNEWNFDSAVTHLTEVALLEEEYAISEINRYLSSPGQGISYKVGERSWLNLREHYLKTKSDKADLKAFHKYALSLGSLPLEVFTQHMTNWINN